ncbi:MAG: hypothetical protein WAV20_08810 [Blastocatellia bacterium]
MLKRCLVLAVAVALALGSVGVADTSEGGKHAPALARKTVSEDPAESAAAIAALRSRGPAGLDAFLEAFASELGNREIEIGATAARLTPRESQRVRAALDQVCAQRDCSASHLFWYTDLNEALGAAKSSGKPILSLRLLGKLDDELSCANSRFFRLILYSNAEVSALLRDRFILHWQSVRPVPIVTIDFGDGRKLQRTLTGNSIHYILDTDGRPMDALPGLYGPQAFIRRLERAARVAASSAAATNNAERAAVLRQYHETSINELAAAWEADVTKANLSSAPSREPLRPDVQTSASPRAELAAAVTVAKRAVVERPVLRGISPDPKALDPRGEDAAWARIADLHSADARLDASSKLLMRAKNPGLYGGSEAPAKASFERAINKLERAIAEDTVRNEFVIHSKIHEWLARGMETDLDALNERVYAELFLTPRSDPWLGLFPRDSYTGIENDGIKK